MGIVVENIFQGTYVQTLSGSISSESLGSASDKARAGVSPYNGLANSARPLPIAQNQSDAFTSGILSRAGSGYSAGVYAPPITGSGLRAETRATQLVTCSASELRPHPSYARHNLTVQPFKLAALEHLGELGSSEPLLITRERYIIDGYARWELATRKGRPTLNCIEYDLTAEQALEELIRKHRRSQGLTDFIRIELALDLEGYFKDKAFLNRQVGGRLKGLSKLTAAEKVNSRTEIARIAQVSVGNVHKVKYVLSHACAPLYEAARTGEISINLADKWSHESDAQQRESLRQVRIERGLRKKARQLVSAELAHVTLSNPEEQMIRLSDLVTLLSRLTTTAAERSKEIDSIEVKVVDGPGQAIFVTEELMRTLRPQQDVLIG